MIQEDYCSFEVAKLLKEKGFNIPIDSKNWICCMYDEDGNIHWVTGELWDNLIADIDDYDYTDEEKEQIIKEGTI